MKFQCVVVLLIVVATVVTADNCGTATDCQDCVTRPYCGWCSVPVKYNDGTKGPQCAGFGQGAKPFTCPEVYSTEVCQAGWICDTAEGNCTLGQPGQGNTLPASHAKPCVPVRQGN